ncbi:MAG: hypothetical protein QOG60_2021 [Frankiaceae bacterium]|nr:hypothetical protein [Frankiaceae bacterium]
MPVAPLRSPNSIRDAAGGPVALIVSASMGAGHDAAARELRDRLVSTGFTVEIRDYLSALRWPLGGFLRTVYGLLLHVRPQLYERLYWALERRPLVRRVAFAIAGVARPALRRWLRGCDADVVVSTYPLASQALGRLRAQGQLPVPLVTYLTDFSVNRCWVHPAVDLHLASSDATAAQARLRGARDVAVAGPVVPSRFRPAARSGKNRAGLRAAWGLAADARVAVLVAGSWGVGEVEPTVDDVLAAARSNGNSAEGDSVGAANVEAALVPVVLCGRNEALRRRLAARPGVVALGWTDRMPEILGAADVLIQNAGGMSCMEAFAVGLPVVSYRCLPGHGQHNASTMAAAGVAPHARNARELAVLLRALLEDGGAATTAAGTASALFVDEPTRAIVALATAPGRLLPTRRSLTRRSSTRRSPGTPRGGAFLTVTALVLTLVGAGATGLVGATDRDDLHVVAHGTATARAHVVALLTHKVVDR